MPYRITCSTKILTLEIAPFLLILVYFSFLCELWSQVCTFYCRLRKKRWTFLLEGTDVHIQQHIYQNVLNLYLSLHYYAEVIVELEKNKQGIQLCYAYGSYSQTK